mmetsp:Transcript_34151/g.57383  ORF Transcript_34151/g.57383 Transcript_34151/m.57383 type:complete len:226 (+) Transcript_34151:318-995(+)
MASSCFRSLICRSYLRISSVGSLLVLMLKSVTSVFTRVAKRRVDTHSSKCWSSHQTFPIITVLQLPPRESLSTAVSLDWRKGMCASFLDSACTVCSKKVSDLLMYIASFSACPSTFVFLVRSDPAKSTKFILDDITLSSAPERVWRKTVNTTCEREEFEFSAWEATDRPLSPSKKEASASSSLATGFWYRPFTNVLRFCSTIIRLSAVPGFSASRSYSSSLYISR